MLERQGLVRGPVVSVHDVRVSYGRRTAIEDVSVGFEPGVTGLLGHNGAGKSTLLGVLTGLVRPTSGEVRLDGRAVRSKGGDDGLRRALGVLPQRFGFFPSFTAREFVEYAAWLRKVPRHETADAVARALELVRLQDDADRRMRELSGGMVQRVGIACAVVHRPRVLVLDEPSNGLDIAQRDIFRHIVRSLDPDTVTIISSHLAEDIAAVCGRVVVLQQGRVVADASTRELVGVDAGSAVTGPDLEQAYLRVLRAHG